VGSDVKKGNLRVAFFFAQKWKPAVVTISTVQRKWLRQSESRGGFNFEVQFQRDLNQSNATIPDKLYKLIAVRGGGISGVDGPDLLII
jgi:hypothetical protein